MKKLWMVVLIGLLLVGCKDEVTSSQPVVVTDPDGGTIPSQPEPQCPANPIRWNGLEAIDEIKQTSVRLRWTPMVGAATYHIFKIQDGKKLYMASANGLKASHILQGLKAGQEYKFMVNVMDQNGLNDDNKNILTITTLPYPDFANSSSIYFDGTQSLATPASDEVLTNDKKWSISLWFRTSINQNGKRLITFHRGNYNDGSAAYLGLEKGRVVLGFMNKRGQLRELMAEFYYHDDRWHNVVGTYKHKTGYKIFIDGKQRAEVKDDFTGFGTQVGHIGSYNNVQMGVEAYIDEISAWSDPLSAKQVAEIYNGGSAYNLAKHSNTINRRAWWRMGDDARDNSRLIHDQFNDLHATGVGVDPRDFSPDSP